MPRRRFGVLWRALLAMVIVVGAAAGATATAGLLEVAHVVQIINVHKALTTKGITAPQPGAPETMLVIGVDHRFGQGSSPGNTDTMILVRLNDSSTTINMLSIPRDLAVDIPGAGTEKINAAYSIGGPSLLLKTIRDNVIPNLKVNHILLVDFASFSNLINALGCVYSDIDQRYYNMSQGAANPVTDYSSINIQPGYQKLCGGTGSDFGGPNTALAFVRFRHNDSDIVREARQQDFLRWAKESLPSGQTLLARRTELLKDFANDVQSDGTLHTTDGLIELFDLAFNSDGSTIKSIPFPYGPGVVINGGDDLSFSEAAAERAYREFMAPTRPSSTSAAQKPSSSGAGKPHSRASRKPRFRLPAYMAADPAGGRAQAAALGPVGIPVYYPQDVPTNFTYCSSASTNCDIGYEPASAYAGSYPRKYLIDGPGSKRYRAYVMTLVLTYGGVTDLGTGEYFTVQGTTWQDPPILQDPTKVVVVNGKRLAEYYQGGALRLVAWHTPSAVYWVSNTIQSNVSAAQMVAMAATFARARG
ncbi:MAG: LCP family protein [Solirubrobacteraceae bacterium]